MNRPCLHPGCPDLVPKGRCRLHQPTTTQRGYGSAWRSISRATIAAQPYCVACGSTSDLTADHVVSGDPSRTQTLCRGCNSRKRHGTLEGPGE